MTTEQIETTPVVATVATAANTLLPPEVVTPDVAAPEVVAEVTKEPESPALTLPGKDATPEQWAAFYDATGRPETAEAYELPIPEGDDGVFANTMKPILHKHGVTAAQAKGLAADWNAMASAQSEAQSKAADAAELAQHNKNTQEAAELTNEWGKSNTANMEFAKRGIAQFIQGDAAQKQAVISAVEAAIGYKETIKFFHGIGKGLAEGGAVGLDAGNGTPQKSIGERMYGAIANP